MIQLQQKEILLKAGIGPIVHTCNTSMDKNNNYALKTCNTS